MELDTDEPTEAAADQTPGKDDAAKKAAKLRSLSKFSKMNIPQDQAIKSKAAELLARIKAKKTTGGESPSPATRAGGAGQPEEPKAAPGPGGSVMVHEWPPADQEDNTQVFFRLNFSSRG